ncbi:MAG: glycoside hydrolase TIM-barrel-like domain-containing protein [bacterium]
MLKNRITSTIIFMMFFPVLVRAAQDSSAVFKGLYEFESGVTQNWVNDSSIYFADNLRDPSVSSAYARDGYGALSFYIDLDTKDSFYNYIHDAAYVRPQESDFSNYTALSMYVYLPQDAGISDTDPLKATLYVKTGSDWDWFESRSTYSLLPGLWSQVSIDFSNAKNANSQACEVGSIDDVRELGLHIFGASDASGNSFLYIDSVGVNTLEHIEAPGMVQGLSVADPGTGAKLHITWDSIDDTDMDGYKVYRSRVYGNTGTLVAETSVNNYTDDNVNDDITYYYQISAYDTYGNEGDLSEQEGGTSSVDDNLIFSMEGATYASWDNDSYLSGSSDRSITTLKETGANFVALVVTQYVDSASSNTIESDSSKTPTDEALVHAINSIHASGMSVMLKPHVDSHDSTWRGAITPSDINEWFSSYMDFITHYASICQDNGVDSLSIGCELKTVSGSLYKDQWKLVIEAIRSVYSGQLTYAANWDEYESVSFWDYIDYVGIDAYFPLSDEKSPSISELVDGWSEYDGTHGSHNWVSELDVWQASMGKNIVFTEIGYRSVDFAVKNPWSWADQDVAYNGTLQASCYDAAIRVFKDKQWFGGMFWWSWTTNESAGGSTDIDYTPQNKPAHDVLTEWYTNGKPIDNEVPSQPANPQGPNKGIAGTCYQYATMASDPDGDSVRYVFDWGDGNTDDTGYVTSGVSIAVVHQWDEEGLFNVRIKVIDSAGNSSGWSDMLEVDITKTTSSEPQEQSPEDFSQVIVYPNPWKPTSGSGSIIFKTLPGDTDIYIYNIVGEKVYEQENIADSNFNWNTNNDSGNKVVSGIYIYLLKDDKGHKKSGKIGIIR